jgi:hypothetical protein
MTTTLPPINNVQVATVPLAAFLAREAAILAAAGTSTPLAEINFLNATVKIGDGAASGVAPQQPSISTLQASGALVHQVWSGQVVQSCSQNPINPNQIDILCVIPAVDSSGAEIGPFWATEFIVTDEAGTPMIAGVTLAPKMVTANGGGTDLAFIVSIGFSVGTVVLTAPSAPWMTQAQIQAGIANAVTGTAPITVAKTIDTAGWSHFNVALDPAAASGRVISIIPVFSSASVPVPTGASRALVEAWGAGGAGGDALVTGAGGSGAGSGGYSSTLQTVAPGGTLVVTVGAAGAPVTGNSGAAGGTTSVVYASTTIVSAGGGGGGIVSGGSAQSIVGAGGVASGGNIVNLGGNQGGAAGGASQMISGQGGHCPLGGAGGGASGGSGGGAGFPGGGGSGGVYPGHGGSGSPGLVKITFLS